MALSEPMVYSRDGAQVWMKLLVEELDLGSHSSVDVMLKCRVVNKVGGFL